MRSIIIILCLTFSSLGFAANKGFDISSVTQKKSCDVMAEGNFAGRVYVSCDGVTVYTSGLMTVGGAAEEQKTILRALIGAGFKVETLPRELAITSSSLTMRVTK